MMEMKGTLIAEIMVDTVHRRLKASFLMIRKDVKGTTGKAASELMNKPSV